MGRLDFGAGRFDADFETREISESLRGWQSEFGDRILYYRFWEDRSGSHDIWSEAGGAGRLYHPPDEVEVLHATHIEGNVQRRTQGLYYNDNLYATASFEQLRRLGMVELDLQHQSYLRDRIVYDFRVFHVTRIQVMGQIQQRDVIVSIEGAQVKPDEMLNDPGFEAFANPKFPVNP